MSREVALKLSKEKLQQLYCIEGLSCPVIANIYDVSPTTIENRLKIYNIKALSRRDRLKLKGYLTLNDLTKDVLRKEYCEDLLSLEKISRKYHTDEDAVSMLRIYWQIPLVRSRISLRRSDISFTEIQKQIIYGSLCGDACIALDADCGSCYFTEEHCIKQSEYLGWKANALKSFLNRGLYECSDADPDYSKIYRGVGMDTFVAPIFNKLRLLFYPNGKKVISRQILNELSELGLAVWYMDDGGNTLQGNSISYDISGMWTDEEKVDITDWFRERWSIDIKFYSSKVWADELIFNVKQAKQLREIIELYIVPSMLYKITGKKKDAIRS